MCFSTRMISLNCSIFPIQWPEKGLIKVSPIFFLQKWRNDALSLFLCHHFSNLAVVSKWLVLWWQIQPWRSLPPSGLFGCPTSTQDGKISRICNTHYMLPSLFRHQTSSYFLSLFQTKMPHWSSVMIHAIPAKESLQKERVTSSWSKSFFTETANLVPIIAANSCSLGKVTCLIMATVHVHRNCIQCG